MSAATHCIPYDPDCSVCNPSKQKTKMRIRTMARDKSEVALIQAQIDNLAAQTRWINAQAEDVEIRSASARAAQTPPNTA